MFVGLPEDKLRVALLLRDIVSGSSVHVSETIKWGRVTFLYKDLPLAFLCMHHQKPGIEIGFFSEFDFNLTATNKRLKTKPKRIRILDTDDVPIESVQQWITLAVAGLKSPISNK